MGELAAALGAEARSKGIDVLLGPTINLMRTPLGGQGFECFSEDPALTAEIAASYVTGLQEADVAATIKHYVGNDSETERWSYDARITELVLRELYLPPFEACVRDADAALVMAAYNKVNGVPMTENTRLLADVLKGEWGFDGVVTSDWGAARSPAATALANLDLVMPGPDGSGRRCLSPHRTRCVTRSRASLACACGSWRRTARCCVPSTAGQRHWPGGTVSRPVSAGVRAVPWYSTRCTVPMSPARI